MQIVCKKIHKQWSIKSLEMLAIREGLKTYLSSGRENKPLIVEANAAEVIKALNFECEDASDTKIVMHEVESLADSTGVISFAKCPRGGNKFEYFCNGWIQKLNFWSLILENVIASMQIIMTG